MPELPDVEIFRLRVEQDGLHRAIDKVSVDEKGILDDVSAETLRRRLIHHRFTSTRRHGKNLFLEIEGDRGWLRLHFGMTGEVRAYGDEEEEPAYTRLRLDFEDGGHLAVTSRRRLGRIGLVDDPDRYVESLGLGPDPWNDPPDPDAFRAMLRERRRAGVKGALMNQELLAGLGNVYVDEMLFQAGIHPETRVGRMDDDALERLRRTMHRVLEGAVERGADPGRMPRGWLLPRREEGASCPRCDGTITKGEVAGRSTYWCEGHQRKEGSG